MKSLSTATTLIQMFEAQAARTPDSVALVFGEDQISFGCLNSRANALACRLREQGVGPEVRVCLCADRSSELVIGILGILKAGGAYVPLDSNYPAAALEFVVEDSRATILLAQRHLAPKLPKYRVPVVWFDNDDVQDDECSSPITQDNLAYIIYTSGSTGDPKGVMISHASVVSLLQATSSIYDFGPLDVWTLFHSHTFDFSVWEMWGSLANGGRLVIVPYVVSRSPDTFLDFLRRYQVTVLNQTPSAFLELQPMSPAGLALRYIIFGGEALDPSAIQPWLTQLVAHGTQFINMYGITETTVHVTWHIVGRNDGEGNRSPIGRPIDSLRVFLLDGWSEPVPLGVGGEIYVSGDGLARGYWNRPALTAERYVPNPFGPPGARLYRSGDRGRCWDDGCLEYLGRADHQVKLRGFRIEPGEIEAALMRQPEVMQACVILRDDDPGDRRLVGYVVAADPTIDEESLRTRLADHLPEHMIPSAIVFMDRFPLTANQKLDRSALPKPERRVRYAQQTSGVLPTPTEQMLTGIWEHILQLDGIAINDNFFEVGGHSLLATQVMSRVRDAFQVDLPLGAIFESPTVVGLALEIVRVQQKSDALPQVQVRATTGSEAPLSFSQQRLWFLEQLQPGTAAYNIPRALRLIGPLDIAAVQLALTEIMRRHAILRTRFPVGKKGVPRQQISEAEPMALPVIDVSGAEALAQQLTWEESHRPFDLERGPVWRALLYRLGEADHVLLVVMHHIVSDGWSAEIMDAEFIELYCAASEHRPYCLPELQIQYADFADWQRRQMDGETLDRSLAYWKTQLADLTPLQLPLARSRPPVPTNRGSVCWFTVPADLSSSLRALSRSESVTLFITLLAGFKVLLAKYTNQWDVAVGSDIANRTRSEIEGLIGFFVNSLVLRSKIDPEWSFREFLSHLRETTLRAYEYQDVPFEKVVEVLAPERDLSHSPLFQVKMVLQNAPRRHGSQQLNVEIQPWPCGTATAKFDLTLGIEEGPDGLRASMEYAADLFDAATIDRLAKHYLHLLSAAAQNPDLRVASLPLLSAAEQAEFLSGPTHLDTGPLTVMEQFERHAASQPDSICAVFGESRVTYGAMSRRTTVLAKRLRQLGAGPEVRVVLHSRRGLDLLTALLGIWKAGAVAVPLDPNYPLTRLASMLDDLQAPVIITQKNLRGELPTGWSQILCIDEPLAEDGGQAPPLNPAGPENLAYIIYTSGSTGRPKGVLVEHGGLSNVCSAQAAVLRAAPGSNVMQFASSSFDASIFEIVLALCQGATLHLVSEQATRSPEELALMVNRQQITHAVLTPAVLSALPESADLGSLHTLVAAGETLDLQLAQTLSRTRRLVNAYGPTEATIWATFHDCDSGSHVRPPIGRPISNTHVYVLDPWGQPVPIGVEGELYIGGAGVARGYGNQPGLTAERFLPDPFAPHERGARMYRTGDVGKRLADSAIEFVGRNDFQVKVRGFRIEPGEVEATLLTLPDVRQAAVVAREDVPGQTRLVAYVVLVDSSSDVTGLRERLESRLPDYMIPSAIMSLPHLPLNISGKVDRSALPVPASDSDLSRNYSEPVGEIEGTVAAIWAEVLKRDRVGRQDNFFELGGHSLMAVRAITRLRRALKTDIAIRDIFDSPVLTDFSRRLARALPVDLPPMQPVDRSVPLPLSFGQQRLWFLGTMPGASEAYHISVYVRLRGQLDREALGLALDRLVTRHEILRTCIEYCDGNLEQKVVPEHESRFDLTDLDLREHSSAAEALKSLAAAEATMAFDFEKGPLIRGRLVRLADEEHALLVTMHHIVSDGWSRGIFCNELTALYSAYLRGNPDPLPKLAFQYADYAAWQRQMIDSPAMQQQAEYWRTELTGVPPLLELPTDRPRPERQIYAGQIAWFDLDPKLTAAVRELSRRHGATLYVTLLAAWAALLARLSGQEDIVVGTPVANRGHGDWEGLVGFFVNTLALRLDVSGATLDAGELIAKVKAKVILAQQNQDIPFERVVEIVEPVRSLAHTPLFQVMFVWQTQQDPLRLQGLEIQALEQRREEPAKFDLTLSMQEAGDKIVGGLWYATSLFDDDTIQRYLGYFRKLLEGMAANDGQPVDQIEILSDFERQQVLFTWNDTAVEYPFVTAVDQEVDRQAARTPDSVAVVFEDQSLTFSELSRRTSLLAGRLSQLGVQPGTCVAICAERSLEMVIALNAVLKAGGAFVPLDPSYPLERLRFMLGDSGAAVVLTQAHLEQLCLECADRVPVVNLDDTAAWWNAPRPDPPVPRHPGDLAYVFYTSGSTGTPKGVMVEHRNLYNRLAWMQEAYSLDFTDAVLQKTPFTFDVSVWEFFWPLIAGGRLIMARPDGHKDPQYLCDVIQRERVTTIHFVPSMLQAFVHHLDSSQCDSLARVFCSGEVLPSALASRTRKQLPRASLHNLYGPTEAGIDVTAWACLTDTDAPGVPIGKPIANTRIYILDRYQKPIPVGVAGELYIAGVQVARGYLNRPELTEERFLQDPFAPDGGRMYKTGDLARWFSDGSIEFLGRNDFQVKIRGIRIELEEIEAELALQSGVQNAVVTVLGQEEGNPFLVAYYTPASNSDHPPDPATLRQRLSLKLPAHMVPAAFVPIQVWPLTANGKLDRRALPVPDTGAYTSKEFEAPRGEAECALAEVWCEVLRRAEIGRDDNFFDLGGHSLLAIRVVELLRRRGLLLDVASIFSAPILSRLAAVATRVPVGELASPESSPELIRLSQDELDRIARELPGGAPAIYDIYPLTPLQEGILFHHLLGGEGDPYVLANQLAFDRRERLDAYLDALHLVVKRHDILRTAVLWEGLSEPIQVVLRDVHIPVEYVDSLTGPDAAEKWFANFNPRRFRIDVRQAPMLRVFVAYDSFRERWLMMQLLHHLAGDHMTLQIIQEEIEAYLLDSADRLSSPLPFRALVTEARLGVSSLEHEAYFRQMLGDVEQPTAPFGLLDVHGDGTSATEFRMALGEPLSRRLIDLGRAYGVSAASLFHLAWAQVLSRVLGSNDVVFGTVLFGRMNGAAGSDRIAGPSFNTLPLRIRLNQESPGECLRQVHAQLAELIRHEYASLALAQRCSAVPSDLPLFTSVLNYRHNQSLETVQTDKSGLAWAGISVIQGEERTNYPLMMSVDNFGDGFAIAAQVAGPVRPERLCEFMLTAVANLVDALSHNPTSSIAQVEVLPATEQQMILETWNQTEQTYPADQCVHELFERRAAECPDAIAIVFEESSLSYAGLNRRANRLAGHLISLGIGPDKLVAVCMSRSIEMVVALLAVMKTGAAYIPLDPSHPSERLSYYIKDSAPSAVLSESRVIERLSSPQVPVIALDTQKPFFTGYSENNPARHTLGLTSDHLAYVIYTSGSSGAPKGTEVSHRAVVNFLSSMSENPGMDNRDCLLAITTISFDIAALEVFLPLVNGARLVMTASESNASGFRLAQLIALHQVTAMQATPVTWQMLLDDGWTPNPSLKMLCGGEALPPDLARDLLGDGAASRTQRVPLDFSVFFFGAVDHEARADAFHLLRVVSQYADAHGFSAIWTPERHFHPFGGIYPNPSVLGGTLAGLTERIQIRAGSVVLPLHDPLRVAEEWAAVDNLSSGRVGVSFASGWNANDFVLAPDRFADRKQIMLREIETVRSLWRGQPITRTNGAGKQVSVSIYPKPVQKELPVWLTAAGSVETFQLAGKLGAGLLTHLLGQDLSSVAAKIQAYRTAFREAGHDGHGHVTLMVHTYVGESQTEARAVTREPMCRYLNQSLDLLKVLASDISGSADPDKMSPANRAALVNHAFERYVSTSALIGDEQSCLAMLERISAAGADEVACLVDFGVELEPTEVSLQRLTRLKDEWRPTSLVPANKGQAQNSLYNMYGPTETTIWSAISQVVSGPDSVGVGKPIGNTRLYILDSLGRPLPAGVDGELFIGGDGVARGYLNRPALTAERFVPDPFSGESGSRLYRTGDLARWRMDGSVEYLGRTDFQVKLRGFRIEPGEIEAALRACKGVREAVVMAHDNAGGGKKLVAYVVAQPDAEIPPAFLRSELSAVLPDYMVPAAFVRLDAIPRTRNGKLDRRALPAPGTGDLAVPAYEPLQSETEMSIATIWQQLLPLERVGRHDNFFAVGGNSLLAIRLVSRLNQTADWDITLKELFDAPTVAALASGLDSHRAAMAEMLAEVENLSEEDVQRLAYEQAG